MSFPRPRGHSRGHYYRDLTGFRRQSFRVRGPGYECEVVGERFVSGNCSTNASPMKNPLLRRRSRAHLGGCRVKYGLGIVMLGPFTLGAEKLIALSNAFWTT